MTMHVKVSAAWKEVTEPSVKVGGAWKPIANIYRKIAGEWVPVFEANTMELIELTQASTVTNYNLFGRAGSPTEAVHVRLTNTGTIGATSTGTAALRILGFPSGSIVEIINQGEIQGAGGDGGDAGSSNSGAGGDGGNGGDAIEADQDFTLNNLGGAIRGGGGGGGGGAGARANYWKASGSFPPSATYTYIREAGGAGGRGRGYSQSAQSGGAGASASDRYREYDGLYWIAIGDVIVESGAGGAGGDWGSNGDHGIRGESRFDPDVGSDTVAYPARGDRGSAGKAIEDNGNTVTITNLGTVNGAIT